MKPPKGVTAWLFALVLLAGCASAQVSSRQSYTGERLARPDRIVVYDFTTNPADVPAESAVKSQYRAQSAPQTAEQVQAGRRLGAEVAKALVAQIQDMGLRAVRAVGQPGPRVGDLVIKGYFVSIDEGSAEKRMVLGFGAGATELKTVLEGYQMTAQGLRLLGRGEGVSGGGETPGMLVSVAATAATGNPVGLIVGGAAKKTGEAPGGSETIEGAAKRTAKLIADELRIAFKKQGWI